MVLNSHKVLRWAQRGFFAAVILALTGLMIAPEAVSAQRQPPTGRTYAPRAVSFNTKTLAGESLSFPTSLQFGPDDRLYVSQQDGTIYAYTVVRDNDTNTYNITATETINLVKEIPNHNDDGTPATDPLAINRRQVTGIYLTGTYNAPVLYVTSSDPRSSTDNDVDLDTNSGIISRLTKNGQGGWDIVHLVRGLPRSEELHSTNGMALDTDLNRLYVMSGGNANMGAPGTKFSYTPEYALSSAMLAVDLNVIDAMPVLTDAENQKYVYDLPTLDDPTRGTPGQPDPGDPFGGNDGLNQAVIVPGGPVRIYSPGYRNAYDVVLTENTKRLYTFDNGPNSQWGGRVVNEGTPNCTNEPREIGSSSFSDNLHYVTEGFYGGHPNPVRANPDGAKLYRYQKVGNVEQLTDIYDFTEDWSPVPFDMADPTQCDFRAPYDEDGVGGVDDGSLAQIPSSTNGLAEYTASNFGNEMKGNLLAASYDGKIYRFVLNEAGTAVDLQQALFSGFGTNPLDVTTQGDLDIFPGTVWGLTYISSNITIFEPVDFIECLGTYDPAIDEDLDGYSNADEIDNGTNPCSGGSVPEDFDHDYVSDLNDDDDDNDGILDVVDAFQIDATNGTSLNLPVDYPFFNSNPGTGFFGLGFTGLMTNGTTDYLTMYDPVNLTAGGATGRFTIDEVSAGDATWDLNTQQNAFQTGINVDANTGPFYLEARMEAPFFNSLTPVNGQAQGVYIGTGDQDNYLRVALIANDGAGALQVTREEDGIVLHDAVYPFPETRDMISYTTIDVIFRVDPVLNLVVPRYRLDSGAEMELGGAVSVPASWFAVGDGKGLALGVIATAGTSGVPFTATWDYFKADFLNEPVVTPTPTETDVPSTTETPEAPTATATATEIAGVELLINGDMETDVNGDKIPDGWQGKKLLKDKQKCNKPEKTIAYQGDCAFMFKGGAGENAKLIQKVAVDSQGFNIGDTLILSGYINAKKATVNGKIKFIVKYAEAERNKDTFTLAQTSGYEPFVLTLPVAAADATTIKVQIVHKSLNGKTFFDALSLKWQAASSALVPLP